MLPTVRTVFRVSRTTFSQKKSLFTLVESTKPLITQHIEWAERRVYDAPNRSLHFEREPVSPVRMTGGQGASSSGGGGSLRRRDSFGGGGGGSPGGNEPPDPEGGGFWKAVCYFSSLLLFGYWASSDNTHENTGGVTGPLTDAMARGARFAQDKTVGTLPSRDDQDEELQQFLALVGQAHAKVLGKGLPSSDRALDASFLAMKENLPQLLDIISRQVSPDCPLLEASLGNVDEHVYAMALHIPASQGKGYDALGLHEILLRSAGNFPGGFRVLQQEGGVGSMPAEIELAGGDRVLIRDGLTFESKGRKGAVFHFRTGKAHSLEGSLYHAVFQNSDGSYVIFRVGVGKAPTLQGKGRGFLDSFNNQMGPASWFLADLRAMQELASEGAVEQLLKGAVPSGSIRSVEDLKKAHQTMGTAARYGGPISRDLVKPLVLPVARAIQDAVRPLRNTSSQSDGPK